jgi:hypothetical protein
LSEIPNPSSDQLDPFFIERGLPAEREISERETSGGVQVKNDCMNAIQHISKEEYETISGA